MLISSTGFLLLIGCANLANLALARGVSREREVVVRASLGAGRWDLIRQFLTENVLLSICGGLFGLVIGYGLMNAMQLMLPPFTLPREVNVAWTGACSSSRSSSRSFTGLLFGMAPALQATKPDLAAAMKEEGRGSSGSARAPSSARFADRGGSRPRVHAARRVRADDAQLLRPPQHRRRLRLDQPPHDAVADHDRAVSRIRNR